MGTRAGMWAKLLEEGGEAGRRALSTLRGQAPKVIDDIIVEDPRLVRQAAAKVLPDIETTAVQLADDLLPAPSQLSLPPGAGAIADDVISSVAPKASTFGQKAAIGAGAAGLGLVGLDAMNSGEPPVSTAVPASILNEANRQLPKGTKVDKPEPKVSEKKTAKVQDTVTEAFQNSGQLPQSNEQKDDFEKQLNEARSKDDDKDVLFGLLRAAQQASGALTNSKADTTFADMNLQDKNKFVNQLAANQALITKRKEANDEDVLRDPNSDISKQARDIATKVGLKIGPNVTAQQLKTAGLPIGNLLTQKMAIDARKEQAALTREALAASKADKDEKKDIENNIKERDKVTKLADNFTKSEDYKGYQAAKTARVALDNALQENNKAAIGSAFMMYAKIAQGDNSVVRESDMKNLAGAYNYTSPAEMISKLGAKARGAGFSPLELQQMKQIASLIENTKAKHLQQQLSPIRTRINKFDLDANEIIDPSVLREMEVHETAEAPSTAGLTTTSKAAISQPGAPVTIRNKQNGSTKTLSTENAAKYLADPRFEKVQ